MQVKRLIIYLVLFCLAILMLMPFAWMVLSSLKEEDEVFTYEMTWLPSKITFSGYYRALTEQPFLRYGLNSLFVAGIITCAQLITGVLAGYAFARLQFPGRNVIFLGYLVAMMIPSQATIIPAYILIRKMGLIDTYAGLTLPFLAGPFAAFMMRQFFLSMPVSLEEAAIIDGCSRMQVLSRIVLPLSKPALASLGLFTFMGAWNDFMWPLIIINRDIMRTLQVGLSLMRADLYPDWPMMMAASVMATAPIIVAFLLAQKQFIQSMIFTGVKY
ncbi:MAG: carbohydrate ABC transporter permease [Bacillota bacterium]|jgi:multiple sugar transport system permease protein|nr:carbohydrate ABC transporter permease [Bacillota bacterium]NLJ02235.1 carbohydrate ABC transporter permease [Bacillota bacterium]